MIKLVKEVWNHPDLPEALQATVLFLLLPTMLVMSILIACGVGV